MLMLPQQEHLAMGRHRVIRVLLSFLIAAAIGYVVASLFSTTTNLIRLGAVGADISVSDAVRTYWFDIRGMAPSLVWTQYGSLIFIGLAIAFPVAAVLRWLALKSSSAFRIAPILYPLAGATAIAVILIASYPKYEVHMLAGSRGALASAAQCLAGAIAGYLFYVFLGTKEVRS
jgi:hypothetical protein